MFFFVFNNIIFVKFNEKKRNHNIEDEQR